MHFKKLFLFFLIPIFIYALPGYEEPWGIDADLKISSKKLEDTPSLSPAGKVAEKIIRFRQEVLSKVDGPRSHFRPTSSQYMLLAIRKYGFLKGYIMGCDRLMRENSDEWVYRKIEQNGKLFKYDPPP